MQKSIQFSHTGASQMKTQRSEKKHSHNSWAAKLIWIGVVLQVDPEIGSTLGNAIFVSSSHT